VCVYLRQESLCGYWASELGCKKVSAPILVKCNHTQIINKITSLCIDHSDEKRQGDKFHWKGKNGGLKSKGIFY
jgi:ribosomal protein L15E